MAARPLVAGTLLIGTLLAGVAQGSHPQPVGPSQTVAGFDHEKGNEWWVEMSLFGYGSCDLETVVLARDTGGQWVRLSRPSWAPHCGYHAGSFHIEPGHRVQFRAEYQAASPLESCWFTHPLGEEQCGEDEAYKATFEPTASNEWWVQVAVSGNKPAVAVDARVDGGTWQALEKRSWGDWAASFHAPQDSLVEFRARSGDGDHAFSHQGWVWPSRAEYPATPPEPPTFRVVFANVKGNEWWVQTNTYSNHELFSVSARVGDGDWRALELRDWGDWAASVHAPHGSEVQFRACPFPQPPCVESTSFSWPPM
jgi:hypothetical protein